jgi:hypothetical protein
LMRGTPLSTLSTPAAVDALCVHATRAVEARAAGIADCQRRMQVTTRTARLGASFRELGVRRVRHQHCRPHDSLPPILFPLRLALDWQGLSTRWRSRFDEARGGRSRGWSPCGRSRGELCEPERPQRLEQRTRQRRGRLCYVRRCWTPMLQRLRVRQGSDLRRQHVLDLRGPGRPMLQRRDVQHRAHLWWRYMSRRRINLEQIE